MINEEVMNFIRLVDNLYFKGRDFQEAFTLACDIILRKIKHELSGFSKTEINH